MTEKQAHQIKTADLIINLSTQQVYKDDVGLSLTDLSYRTLLCLVNHAPEVISVDHLITEVWQDIEVSSETVTQRIAMLRKALGQVNHTSINTSLPYIKSIRNRGYAWVPLVHFVEVDATLNNQANVKSSPVESTKKKAVYWWLVVGFLLSIPAYYLFKQYLGSTESVLIAKVETQKPKIAISSQVGIDEFTAQGWRYLGKHDAKSTELAVGLFRKTLAEEPDHASALIGLSMALSHQVTKFNQSSNLLVEAQKAAQQVISKDAENAQAWAALAFVYDAMGEINQAVNHYEKALSFNPEDMSTASSLAYLYAEQGKLVEALRLNVSALGSQQLYLDLQVAHVLDLLGFDAVAGQWYLKADSLTPDNVFATHLRARYYLAGGEFQNAQTVVNEALARGVERPELHLIQGVLRWIHGDLTEAITAFKKAVEIDADDGEAQAWLFMAKNSTDIATEKRLAFINQWFTPDNEWPQAWISEVVFHAHFGDESAALKSLEKAFEAGYRNYAWLNQLPPLQKIQANSTWRQVITAMQNDVNKQRQAVIQADWLPTSFLDPQN